MKPPTPFFDKQPPMFFVEDLKKPLHSETPKRWNTRPPAEDEVFIQSAQLSAAFEDPAICWTPPMTTSVCFSAALKSARGNTPSAPSTPHRLL